MALDVTCQIGRLLGEIGERQLPRILLDRRQLGRQAEMFQPDGAGELQQLGRAVELGDGDRVAECVVDPAHLGGGVDGQAGMEQAQIVAVARPEHQAMFAQRHRGRIVVARAVDDLEGAHGPR